MQKTVSGFGILLVLSIVFVFFMFTRNVQAPIISDTQGKIVTVESVSVLGGNGSTLSLLGTVEAVHEAQLTAEAGGRVTSVYKKLGDIVSAGAIIGTIENSTERATVLQAEGVYEAAKAGARASTIGSAGAVQAYEEAITQAQNTYRNAFTTADNILRDTIDDVFSHPSPKLFGYRLNSGNAQDMNAERLALEGVFSTWKDSLTTLNSKDAESLLTIAESNTRRLRTFTSTLNSNMAKDAARSLDRKIELETFRADFARALQTLDGTLQSLSLSRSALTQSKSQKDQSDVGVHTGDVSLADAQVKQALGALRYAQANLEKTIVRSPIGGTITSLELKEGTSVSMGTPVATISSTRGLEVVTYSTEAEAGLIHIGDSVILDKTSTGKITQIASAIDAQTKKIEVRIGVDSDTSILINGQSVSIEVATKELNTATEKDIRLPIVSFKMTPDGPAVFTVNGDNTLVSHPVVLGAIIGDKITVLSGVTSDMNIVTDARGLRAGELVSTK